MPRQPPPPRPEYSQAGPDTPEHFRPGKTLRDMPKGVQLTPPRARSVDPAKVAVGLGAEAPPTLRPPAEIESEPPPTTHAQAPLHGQHGRFGQTLTGVGEPGPTLGLKAPVASPAPSNPPPRSVPTSQAERELAKVRAAIQDARELAEHVEKLAASEGLQPWWRSAKGMAIVLPLLVTLVTALTASSVVIIKAVREPYDGARAKDIAEAKAAGARAEDAVTSEKRLREAGDADAAKATAEVAKKYSELDQRFPALKADPNRRPRNP